MNTNSFSSRHIGVNTVDANAMLEAIGLDSIDQLIHETLPDGIKLEKELQLDNAMSEHEYLEHIHFQLIFH